MPSLKQLQVFVSIARHGSLGAAADEVCLSKGAVSQALAELERRLGSPVFDRVHPHLRLNEQGSELLPLAQDVLDRMEDIRHLFDAGGVAHGVLRLGASQTIGNYVLPSLLAQLPDVEADVQIHNTHDLCEMLKRFELDLALIEGRNHAPELTTQAWRKDEMLIVAAPSHPLARQDAVSWDDLRHADWVLREPHSGSREQFERDVAPLVQPLGTVRVLNSIEAGLLAVESGLGLSFASRLAVQERVSRRSLVALKLGQTFTRRLSLIWHRQKFHNFALRHFIDSLKTLHNPAEL